MKEIGIIFSTPMVRALLLRTKTETRRLIRVSTKPCCAKDNRADRGVPHNYEDLVDAAGSPNAAGEVFGTDPYLACPTCSACDAGGDRVRCRYKKGQRLYVKESWAHDAASLDEVRGSVEDVMRGGVGDESAYGPYYKTNRVHENTGLMWRSSLMMPKWAARIWLTVTDVRIERLQAMTSIGARAEGMPQMYGEALHLGLTDPRRSEAESRGPDARDIWDNSTSLENYARGFDALNGDGVWAKNPFVSVIRFTVDERSANNYDLQERW